MPRDDIGSMLETRPSGNPAVDLVSTEAEQALLGALLMRNALYERVVEIVRESDFANGVHGRIYAAIGKLINRGTVADPITLMSQFDRDDALKTIGGSAYLGRLVGSAVTFINAPDYARTIAELARRRGIILACQDAIADASIVDQDRPPSLILEDFDRRLIELGDAPGAGDPVSIEAAVDTAIQAAEIVYKADGRVVGVSTGLADLDRRLGGLHPADLIIIAGRPAMGKTALATTIAENAARTGRQTLIFELEMSARDLAARQLGAKANLSAEQQRAGPISRDEMNRLITAREHFAGLPLTIDDTPAASVTQLRARSRRHKRRHGLDLIVVDYLQLLMSDNTRPENRVQEVSAITRGLKMLAKELRVPVIALSQLSREVEKRDDKRPVLSDLRESGSIEQDADIVMFLYREEEYLRRDEPKQRTHESHEAFSGRQDEWQTRIEQHRGIAEVLVRKNRHGSTCNVRLRFDAARTVFENLAWGEAAP